LSSEVERFSKARILHSLPQLRAEEAATRPSYVIEIAIYWKWFVTFICILSELQWSSGPRMAMARIFGKEKRGLIDSGPVIGELRTAARYEALSGIERK
jgi:hypothetical protein